MNRHARTCIALAVAVLLLVSPGTAGITLESSAAAVTVGETVRFTGTCTGVNTAFVYLMMTGPGLPSTGSALEGAIGTNHSIVQLNGISWDYRWDTGLVVGGLEPGAYTVYAATAPVGTDALGREEYAAVSLAIGDPAAPGPTGAGSLPGATVLALIGIAGAAAWLRRG